MLTMPVEDNQQAFNECIYLFVQIKWRLNQVNKQVKLKCLLCLCLANWVLRLQEVAIKSVEQEHESPHIAAEFNVLFKWNS